MSEQNDNPDNEAPVFTKSEMDAIVQQRLAQDRARRGNPAPASTASAPTTSAPAGSGDMGGRLDKIEGMFSTLIERLTPAAPQASAAAATAPDVRPPPAAPAAPRPHELPTNAGLVDIWNMAPHQIDHLGPAGIRAEFERHLDVGHKAKGRPPVPQPPGSLTDLRRDVDQLRGRMGR